MTEEFDLSTPRARWGSVTSPVPPSTVHLSQGTVDAVVAAYATPGPVADPNAQSVWDRPVGETTLWGLPLRIEPSLPLRRWEMRDSFDAVVAAGEL